MSDEFETQLRRLITGLADQDIRAGSDFAYDGGELSADEVADIAMPSIVCLAQDLSVRLGLSGFGYAFELGEPNPVFPLVATHDEATGSFVAAAPFVVEVFEREVRECRHDLAHLFEIAARHVDPAYALSTHTTYTAADPGDGEVTATGPLASGPAMER